MTDEPRRRGLSAAGSHYLQELGRAGQISAAAVRRARAEMIVLGLLFVAVILLFDSRAQLIGKTSADQLNAPIRGATVLILVILGWWLARDVGRGLGPELLRHMDPAAAGTAGFVIRLFTVGATIIIAALFAGIKPGAVAVGGAFTAVIFGLAAQQTLGNLIAGTVLLSARPFRVGERVRLQGAPGRIEGIVSSLGLLYTTFADGDDRVMVPNSVVLNSAVTPLREPAAVNLRARLRAGVTPSELQQLIERALSTPIRSAPQVTLVELDGDEVVVEISATPQVGADGAKLASDLLEIVSRETPQSTAAATDEVPAPAARAATDEVAAPAARAAADEVAVPAATAGADEVAAAAAAAAAPQIGSAGDGGPITR